VVLVPLATLTLILPTYTTSAPGPLHTPTQFGFVSLATLVLYSVFLYVQTIRHRDYFLSDSGDDEDDASHGTPGMRQVWERVVMLLVALTAVVLPAKGISGSIEATVASVGAPIEVIGLLVALRSAWRNKLQESLNLALESSLATIGLTIPAVSALAIVLEQPLELGIALVDIVLLVLTFGVILVTLGAGGPTFCRALCI
jgi:Ca2+:H+ antiporter